MGSIINAGMPTGLLTLAVPAVSVTAQTSLPVPGLNLSNDGEFYLVLFKLDNATGSSATVSLMDSADTAAANYYRQGTTSNAGTLTGGRGNNADCITLDANETATGYAIIQMDTDGKVRMQVRNNRGAPSAIIIQDFIIAHNVAGNLLGLVFTSSVANAITGTVKVYKIGGPQEGTSFPANPSNGQRFRRTDLKLDCTYYTGIGWLTDNIYEMPLYSLGLVTQTSINANFGYYTPPDGYGVYLLDWYGSTSVATTNNGSNYWTITLYWRTTGGVATALTSFTTAADSTGFTKHTVPINAVLDPTTTNMYYSNTAKTGSPGNITPVMPSITYRKIVT